MNHRMTTGTAALLTLPPLMWAGNAVVGRMMSDMVPPMTLNLMRWMLAFVLLLPLAGSVLRRDSGLWTYWRRFAVLGLLSVGLYNALQYLALHTSTPINVTLVASSTPVWMILLGRLFFGARIQVRQLAGASLSICGVLVVLSRGSWGQLMQLRPVAGDVYVLLASMVWAFYSWMLVQPGKEPAHIRNNWAAFLMAQVVFGLLWSGLLAAGEWATAAPRIQWGWPVAAALLFIALGPSLLAYRSWSTGIQRTGPTVAGFFANLTPLFAAVMSSALLGEVPQVYHGMAFLLIIAGIWFSSRK